jgi:clumping factor A
MSRLFIAILMSALLFACSNEGSSNSGSSDRDTNSTTGTTDGSGAVGVGDTGGNDLNSASEEIDARNEEILQDIDTSDTTSVDGGVSDTDTSSDSSTDGNSNSNSSSSSLDDTNDLSPGNDGDAN